MEKIKVTNSGTTTLQCIEDAVRGSLFIAETQKNLPIDVKRFYFIKHLTNADVRGQHAHKQQEQYIFCLSGSFRLSLDDGTTKQEIVLDKSEIGVRLGAKLWHSMDRFSEDCIIFVACNEHYDEKDYIRDYADFLLISRS